MSHQDLPLLALLESKEEDRFTAYLAALLRLPSVGLPFLERFCAIETTGEWLDVETQFAVADGRPDVVIRGDNFVVVIEVKLESGLRPGQLKPYDAFLRDQQEREKRLVVLVVESDKKVTQSVASNDLARPPSVITWEEVGGFCAEQSRGANAEEPARTWLDGFSQLLKFRLRREARKMTTDEMAALQARGVASGLQNTIALLEPIRDFLVAEEFALTKSTAFGYEGYTIRHKKRWWWVGVWFTAWAATGQGPLLLQLPGAKSTKPSPQLPGAGKPLKNEADGANCWVVPLELLADEPPADAGKRIGAVIARWVAEQPDSGG